MRGWLHALAAIYGLRLAARPRRASTPVLPAWRKHPRKIRKRGRSGKAWGGRP